MVASHILPQLRLDNMTIVAKCDKIDKKKYQVYDLWDVLLKKCGNGYNYGNKPIICLINQSTLSMKDIIEGVLYLCPYTCYLREEIYMLFVRRKLENLKQRHYSGLLANGLLIIIRQAFFFHFFTILISGLYQRVGTNCPFHASKHLTNLSFTASQSNQE